MWMTLYWIFGSLFVLSIAAYILLSRQHRRELQPLFDKALAAAADKKST